MNQSFFTIRHYTLRIKIQESSMDTILVAFIHSSKEKQIVHAWMHHIKCIRHLGNVPLYLAGVEGIIPIVLTL